MARRYKVYYQDSPVPGLADAELVGIYTSVRAARKALREAVGVYRCDDRFIPACANGEVITGADTGKGDTDDSPFGWVEV